MARSRVRATENHDSTRRRYFRCQGGKSEFVNCRNNTRAVACDRCACRRLCLWI